MKTRLLLSSASLFLTASAFAQTAKPATPSPVPNMPARPASQAPAPVPPPKDATAPASPGTAAPKVSAPSTTPAPKAVPTVKTPGAAKPAAEAAKPEKSTAPEPNALTLEPKAAPAPALITSDLGGRDLQFLMNAAENGKVLLYLGNLAKTKADAEQVKALGDLLSSTQLDENRKLAQLAARKGVQASDAPPAEQKSLEAKLAKLTGPKFDKTSLEEIVKANERAVATYEAAGQTKDAEIRAFIGQGLALAQEKLKLANKMTGNAARPAAAPRPPAAGAEAR
jgi:hypothetical protein